MSLDTAADLRLTPAVTLDFVDCQFDCHGEMVTAEMTTGLFLHCKLQAGLQLDMRTADRLEINALYADAHDRPLW